MEAIIEEIMLENPTFSRDGIEDFITNRSVVLIKYRRQASNRAATGTGCFVIMAFDGGEKYAFITAAHVLKEDIKGKRMPVRRMQYQLEQEKDFSSGSSGSVVLPHPLVIGPDVSILKILLQN